MYPMEAGKMSKFTQTYRELISEKVTFPSTRRYFVSNMTESKKDPVDKRISQVKNEKPKPNDPPVKETPKEIETKPKAMAGQQKKGPRELVKYLGRFFLFDI